jgi:3'(2'), 5'-bisphosphate nucleotidase
MTDRSHDAMNYSHDLETALAAADEAGRVILDHYGRFTAIPDAKADISTAADRDAQEVILQHLLRVFPTDALRAEENTPTLAAAPRTGARMWIVDPIDGTRGFARKNGEFSVMIALLDQGQAVVGVVLEPVSGRLTYATRGGGCWRRDGKDSTAQRCQVRPIQDIKEAVLTQSHTRTPSRQASLVALLQPARVLETYSAGIKLAQVARGEADVYLNTYPQVNDWDICAGHILVEEAGGQLSDLQGQPIHYGQEPGQRAGLLASNGRLHEQVLAVTRA